MLEDDVADPVVEREQPRRHRRLGVWFDRAARNIAGALATTHDAPAADAQPRVDAEDDRSFCRCHWGGACRWRRTAMGQSPRCPVTQRQALCTMHSDLRTRTV